MVIRFGQQEYHLGCVLCGAVLEWPRSARKPEERISAVAGAHLEKCPARILDPAWMRRRTAEELLAEAKRVREEQAGGV
jgi:hypothetical protein